MTKKRLQYADCLSQALYKNNRAVLLALLHCSSSLPSFPVASLDLLSITAAGQHRLIPISLLSITAPDYEISF